MSVLGGGQGFGQATVAGERRHQHFSCRYAAGGVAGQTAQDAPRCSSRSAQFTAFEPHRCAFARRGYSGLGTSHGSEQTVFGHHWRPHRGWLEPPRSYGGSMAGACGRLRHHIGRFQRLRGRGHEHGRAHTHRRAQPSSIRPHGGGRGHHQFAGCTFSDGQSEVVCQLDGRLRRSGRGRRLVRHRQSCRTGAVSGLGHIYSCGQRQFVDAHPLERSGRTKASDLACELDRYRVCGLGRCTGQPHTPARCGARQQLGADRFRAWPKTHGCQHVGANFGSSRRRYPRP